MTAASAALPTAVRARFIAWSACMLVVAALFAFRVVPNLRIETDILALLPNAQQDTQIDAALNRFSAELARKHLFLIGASDGGGAKNAARAFATSLRNSPAFTKVTAELSGATQERFAIHLQHRAFLLSPADLQALRSGNSGALEQRALREAFTPAGLMRALSIADDPLGFTNRFLAGQHIAIGNAELDGAMLVVRDQNHTYALVTAESAGSPFATSVQEQAIPAIEAASRAAQDIADVRILSSGAVRHAAAARERATAEIATFGTLELIGVIVLLWTMLGAVRPLALAAITLGMAVMTSLTAVHFLFGTVHILALVFGSSLIGGVIDYSIHFFADRLRDPRRWTPVDALKQVGGAILLGLTATVIGYLVLALVPFPGLKQIAVFCAVGLSIGCGCVLCWYPLFAKPGHKPPPTLGARIGAAIDGFMRRWRWTRMRIATALAIGTVIAFGIARVAIQDDIRALQQSPPHLAQQEDQVRELLGSGVETRFFLVTGDSPEAALNNEQRLTAQLDALVTQGALGFYLAVSSSVPPLAQQQEAHRLLSEQVYAENGALTRVMNTLGFPADAIERRRQDFFNGATPLSMEAWLAAPASEATRHLWLGNIGERYASIVTLGGVRDVAALTQLKLPETQLIDRVASTTEILGDYRRVMSLLLILIYAVAGVVLSIRFGWREAPRILLPSMLAMIATIGLFGLFGVPVNLFTLLALWLVLGLGIDYGIFLRHAQLAHTDVVQGVIQPDRVHAARTTAILSVTLSACTTLLAFGPLSFSATPFIRSIGLTLLCAIMLSWAFVMFSCLTTFAKRSVAESENHG